MAVGVWINVPNPPQEQMQSMGQELMPKIKDQPGFALHISGLQDDGNFLVIEVWDSREDHQKWIQNHVLPAAQRAGAGDNPPRPNYFNVNQTVT